jgi:hypothetical protein
VKHEKGGEMSVQLQIGEMSGHLEARFIGAFTIDEAKRQFKLLAEKCKCTNKNRLLLDLTGVPANLSLVDLYSLGKRALVFAQFKCKVAAVCKPEQYDSTSFLETTAQNRWIDLRLFTDTQSAIEWLLK